MTGHTLSDQLEPENFFSATGIPNTNFPGAKRSRLPKPPSSSMYSGSRSAKWFLRIHAAPLPPPTSSSGSAQQHHVTTSGTFKAFEQDERVQVGTTPGPFMSIEPRPHRFPSAISTPNQ